MKHLSVFRKMSLLSAMEKGMESEVKLAQSQQSDLWKISIADKTDKNDKILEVLGVCVFRV